MDLDRLDGAADVISWFGYMPSFHDAEVLEISLHRNRDSRIALYYWNTTNQLDEAGEFVRDKHAVVTFKLTGITDLSLEGFSHQKVIFGVEVEELDGRLKLELQPSYGVVGAVTAERISLELLPGKPARAE